MVAALGLGFLQGLYDGIALVVVISYSYRRADRVETAIVSNPTFASSISGPLFVYIV